MTTLQDYINAVQTLVHDTNASDFSIPTLTSFINQARYRVAMDTHCVRGFFSLTGGNALNTITQQENYNYNNTIGGTTVTAGGTNYTSPRVSFVGGGGSGAAATAITASGVITEINMTDWGVNYTSTPNVVINDSTGTGASGSATLLQNIIDIISISVIWGDERYAFRWLPFSAFQAYCRQYTNQYDVPGVFTTHNGIQQVFMFQIPDQPYPMEWDYWTVPNPLINTTDIDIQVVTPWNDAVQFYAAHLCMASLQNFQAADYWYSGNRERPGKYDTRIKQLFATSFERRVINPYYTWAKMIRRV